MLETKKPHGNTGKKRDPATMPRKPRRLTDEDKLNYAKNRYKGKSQFFVALDIQDKTRLDTLKLKLGIKGNQEFMLWLIERGERSLARKND